MLDRSGRDVDPATIDWSVFRSGNIPYTLRQDPGPKNALGRVKFMFPTTTPLSSRHTFDDPVRRSGPQLQFGCVRVENPLEFARLLLDDPAQWNDAAIAQALDAGRTQNVTLKRKIPVLLAYWTAWVIRRVVSISAATSTSRTAPGGKALQASLRSEGSADERLAVTV